MSSIIKAIFTADTGQFEGGASRMERSLEGLEKSAHKTNLQLRGMKHLLEFGGAKIAFDALKEGFKSLIEFAENDKAANDANTEAVRRFGKDAPKAMDTVKAAGVQVLGVLNRIGEEFGEGVSYVLYGAEAVEQFNQIADAADELDKKVNANADKKAKALGIELTGEWEKKTIKEKVAAIEEAQKKAAEKAAEEHKKTMAEINKLEFEHLSLRDKIIAKQKEYAAALQSLESANEHGTQKDKDDAKLAFLQKHKELNDLFKTQDEQTARLAEVKNQFLIKQNELAEDARTAAQRANLLQEEANTLEARAGELADDDVEYWKLKAQAIDKIIERNKILNEAHDKEKQKEKEITAEIQKRGDLLKKETDARTAYATSNRDRASRSLGEIAQGAPGVSATDQYRAREVQRLEEEGKATEAQSSRKGDAYDVRAAENFRKADALRGQIHGLRSEDRDPLAAQKAAMKEPVEELKKINAKIDEMRKELSAP